jgi:gamma-tubulin complex component 3
VSQPTKDLLHRLAELGYLYRKISTAIAASKDPSCRIGTIEQSLYHALQKELTAYYRLIALLESRLTLDYSKEGLLKPLQVDRSMQQDLPLSIDGDTGLTLRRLTVWTEDTKLRMRMMAVLTEGCTRPWLAFEL